MLRELFDGYGDEVPENKRVSTAGLVAGIAVGLLDIAALMVIWGWSGC